MAHEDDILQHNHEILEPENNELFHPESDPRVLQATCPACKAKMVDWALMTDRMIREGV